MTARSLWTLTCTQVHVLIQNAECFMVFLFSRSISLPSWGPGLDTLVPLGVLVPLVLEASSVCVVVFSISVVAARVVDVAVVRVVVEVVEVLVLAPRSEAYLKNSQGPSSFFENLSKTRAPAPGPEHVGSAEGHQTVRVPGRSNRRGPKGNSVPLTAKEAFFSPKP